MSNKELLRMLRLKWCNDRLYAIGEDSWSRPHTALEIAAAMRQHPNVVWPFLMEAWSCFDLIPHQDYEDLLALHRKKWSPRFMTDDNRKMYEELPDEIVIYRGQDRGHPIGLSWTLSQDIAAKFARGHRWLKNENPVVLQAIIAKNDVAFVCTDRNEQEVVAFSVSAIKDMTVMEMERAD